MYKNKILAKAVITDNRFTYQYVAKENCQAELIVANKELAFQHTEKEKRTVELMIANSGLRKTEKMVREREQLLSSIYDTVADVIFVLEVEDEERYVFSSVNKAFLTTTGIPYNSIIGKYVNDILPEHSLVIALKKYKEAIHGKKIVCWEETSDYPNGRLVGEVSIAPLFNEAGNCFRLIGAVHDITELKKAEQQKELDNNNLRSMEKEVLQQKIEEQKKISRAIIKAQEKERNHIGQELHDNVNQILAGTKMYLGMAGKDNVKLQELIKYPMELIDNTIKEIRLLSGRQVTPLKNINLKELIESLLDDLAKNSTVKINLVYNVADEFVDDDLKLNIYRIIQEQINNIMKHADSKNVSVSVVANLKTINIVVRDDGKGFVTGKKRKGIGISNMMNRIKSFNGNLVVKSSPGNGCALQIMIPY